MKNDIVTQVQVYIKQKFSGHIKFGIEKGSISNLAVTNNLSLDLNPCEDWFKKIEQISENNFFGSIEIEMVDGNVTGLNWLRTFKNLDLFCKLKECKER